MKPVRPKRAYRTSEGWRRYFQVNAQRQWPIPWESGVSLTPRERALVAASIQTFQLGESGTGRHLFRAADAYAARTGDHVYPAALRLFVAEEHRHAADLGRVLDLGGIDRVTGHWSDRIFRGLRHLAGLEACLCILLTAELIAKIYYAALRQATGAAVLCRLCEQILRDEGAHIRFQCEQLAVLRRSRPAWALLMARGLQRAFFRTTCCAFWLSHGPVMRAGGYGWRRFWRRARNEFAAAAQLMDPSNHGSYREQIRDAQEKQCAPLCENV